MASLPQPKSSPLAREVLKVKSDLDALIANIQKNNKFVPTRAMLEEHAERLIDFINNNHKKIAAFESHLKAAIIDLTEVPVMAPEMQRIAFQTALKDASERLNLFLSCL